MSTCLRAWIVCDWCMDSTACWTEVTTIKEAWEIAHHNGWRRQPGQKHICPTCLEQKTARMNDEVDDESRTRKPRR